MLLFIIFKQYIYSFLSVYLLKSNRNERKHASSINYFEIFKNVYIYIKKFLFAPQKSHFGKMRKIVVVTTKFTFIFRKVTLVSFFHLYPFKIKQGASILKTLPVYCKVIKVCFNSAKVFFYFDLALVFDIFVSIMFFYSAGRKRPIV